jgi:hypothetical protein
MDGIERLLAIEEIRQVFARRLRYMDLKQWELYGSVHTEDAASETYGDLPGGRTQRRGLRIGGNESWPGSQIVDEGHAQSFIP